MPPTAGGSRLDRRGPAGDGHRARRGGRDRRPPVVYGDWLHADGAPTVLVYCHYDVQPVDPLELWDSPPFEPVVVGDRMLARGAADDKGQLHLHLRATEAILATRGALPVNLKFVFEGEEESSSDPPRALARGQQGSARGGLRADQRHGLLRGQPAGDHRRAARDHVRPDRRHRHCRRPPLGRATAAPSRTRPTLSPGSSPRSRDPTGGSGSPASTTTSCR